VGEATSNAQPWRSLEELAGFWSQINSKYKLVVDHDVLRHARSGSSASNGIIEHEVARLQLDESHQAMEIRLRCDWDEACGMAAVTRLVQPREDTALDLNQINKLHEVNLTINASDVRVSRNPSLAMLCLALPQCEHAPPSPLATLSLLATPYGPDRRAIRSDGVEKENEDEREVQERELSELTLAEATLTACKLCNAYPMLGQQLLLWILEESPVVVEKSVARQNTKRHLNMERALLALPPNILDNESLLNAVQGNWAVGGKALTMLIKWRLGKASFVDLLLEMNGSDWMEWRRLIQLRPKGDSVEGN
jgi:hypothetical protein